MFLPRLSTTFFFSKIPSKSIKLESPAEVTYLRRDWSKCDVTQRGWSGRAYEEQKSTVKRRVSKKPDSKYCLQKFYLIQQKQMKQIQDPCQASLINQASTKRNLHIINPFLFYFNSCTLYSKHDHAAFVYSCIFDINLLTFVYLLFSPKSNQT